MINAVHAVIYTKDAEADRAFFKDVLGLKAMDAGGGWLIFALPPAELGLHPASENGRHEIYLLCDSVNDTVAELEAKGVEMTQPVTDAGFGLLTGLRLPGGGEVRLYQPTHPSPLRKE